MIRSPVTLHVHTANYDNSKLPPSILNLLMKNWRTILSRFRVRSLRAYLLLLLESPVPWGETDFARRVMFREKIIAVEHDTLVTRTSCQHIVCIDNHPNPEGQLGGGTRRCLPITATYCSLGTRADSSSCRLLQPALSPIRFIALSCLHRGCEGWRFDSPGKGDRKFEEKLLRLR